MHICDGFRGDLIFLCLLNGFLHVLLNELKFNYCNLFSECNFMCKTIRLLCNVVMKLMQHLHATNVVVPEI